MAVKDIKIIELPDQKVKGQIGYTDRGLFFEGKRVRPWVLIRIMKIRKGHLLICGSHYFDNLGECSCYFRDDEKKRYKITLTNTVTRHYDYEERGELILKEQFFEADIELGDIKYLEFAAVYPEGAAEDIPKRIIPALAYGRHGKLDFKAEGVYYAHDSFILTRHKKRIVVEKADTSELIRREREYGKELESLTGDNRLSDLRAQALDIKLNKDREIWIVCDRDNAARDNGEALFRYLIDNEKEAQVYFAIGKDCTDYERMKQYGNVLELGSPQFYRMFLASDKVISSQSGDWVTNPFGDDGKYMQSMYDFDFVFLQHGIILNDLSNWFVYYLLDISLFVTSARREYDAVSNYGYNVNDRTVKLTGLPRFDLLENAPEKKIAFMPTWRKDISGEAIPGTSHREYSEAFKDSDYFRFFNGLINSPELLGAMKEYGYTGEMYIHPAFTVQAKDFKGNDTISVSESIADYSEVFKKSALMVTDYSSVAFDFAYLKKPIVYTLFDSDTFFEGHHCSSGYFNYEKDGFGPVCYDLTKSIDKIIEYMKNDCIMEDSYRERSEQFFAYTDKDNCKRVHEAIKSL